MSAPLVSVVVPVLRDSEALLRLLDLPRDQRAQWIVVNGDASDRTVEPLRAAHPDVVWVESAPGRGVQVAEGAARARGRWVLVLHADTRLPDGWLDEMAELARAASRGRPCWGCFRLRLDTSAWQARLIEGVVRIRVRIFRLPYGDQAMFFHRETLERLGGVPRIALMEDVALARRFARLGPPYRSSLAAVTSARRWEREGWWRRTRRNWWLLTRYLLGASPDRLAAAYVPGGAASRPSSAGPERC